MPPTRHVFKERAMLCSSCGAKEKRLLWSYQDNPLCACGTEMSVEPISGGQSAFVLGDEMDLVVRHGPCNPDGTPRRFRSRAEWKRACIETGWTPDGDTPKTKEERSRWI